ncbi:lipopolysaccharide biosynthesis protein [Dorea formicigenerans]|uniref:Lipopolysaccharide biosynthesis protein n=1 Tax=Dorea formicigenerans TaxID=39486 RepID=A0A413W0V6_9FIRM|nr:lipopolysaccharide biosynthesis protein [Dorea formicigenerans]RHB39452.1 lipopolysaccharide biosynthesis protein [Dorea formicigenerans]
MGINENVQKASKWSLLTELLTKLMSPIVNMILARLISPEAFGMVATITMVTSFADLFTDSGFQKYLVQRKMTDSQELDKDTNVAFWTNLSLSIMLWFLIFLFRDGLAVAVGNKGLGNAISIATLSLPLTSFSSIQMARFRRDFDFKTLFWAKIIGILIPLFVTLPLAFVLKNYWAIVIGNIAVNLSNAVLLTIRSKWKPSLYFSFLRLKKMLSFSMWTLLEQLLGWANLNVAIFIVGRFLSPYYLGLYKTSIATTNQIMLILVNAFSPVLFSALSRLKDDSESFLEMYYSFIRKTGFIVLPLGIGIFIFKDLFVKILLGSQWSEAATFIGLWGMLKAINIIFGYYSMEVFVALGRPKYSVITQILELVVLLPVLIFTVPYGYKAVYLSRCAVVIWSIIIEMLFLHIVAKISVMRSLKSTRESIVSTLIMGCVGGAISQIYDNVIWSFFSVVICIFIYFITMLITSEGRKIVKEFLRRD